MARIRSIKQDLFLDEEIAKCSIAARYLFPGLWTIADREGRLEDRPPRIKALLYPYDDEMDINALLDELQKARAITRYWVKGHRFIAIRTFTRHQKCHKNEMPSRIPAPPKRKKLEKSGNLNQERVMGNGVWVMGNGIKKEKRAHPENPAGSPPEKTEGQPPLPKSPENGKPQTQSDPRWTPLLLHMKTEYERINPGMAFKADFDKSDGNQLAAMIKRCPAYTLETLRAAWTAFMESGDDFHEKKRTGHPVRYWSSNVNQFVSLARPKPQKYEPGFSPAEVSARKARYEEIAAKAQTEKGKPP